MPQRKTYPIRHLWSGPSDMHGLPNVVTALLASYRRLRYGSGKPTVVLTAGIGGVLLIFAADERDGMSRSFAGEHSA